MVTNPYASELAVVPHDKSRPPEKRALVQQRRCADHDDTKDDSLVERYSYLAKTRLFIFARFGVDSRESPSLNMLSDLAKGLCGDALGSIVTAAIVAPAAAILDKGITQHAAGAKSLWQSVVSSVRTVVVSPASFLRSPDYGWLFALYSLTYFSANSAETICASLNIDRTVPQLALSTGANMTMSIAKDRAFARAFGVILPTRLPASSYACWLGRDAISMFFFFTLPPLLNDAMADRTMPSKITSSAARFLSPIVAQFFTTPLHLLGFDFYNRRTVPLMMRISLVGTKFPATIAARITRIVPTYSFGSVCNASIRSAFSSTFV